MRLVRLHLVGFGRFQDQVIEFGPGLNLIYGPNESGKSTLLNFIRGMLFGFKRPGNRRSFEEILEQYRPWAAERYYGSLEYRLDNRVFRVERDFEPSGEKVRVLDGETWDDLTASFPMDKRREVLFAQAQLGMNQTVFDNTVCVRQLQSKSSEDLAGEIQAKLVNLVSTGEEEVSIQRALQALETALRDLGLSERAGKSVLGRATAKVEELERARQTTLGVYAEIREAESKRRDLAGDIAGFNLRYQEICKEVSAAQADEIEVRLAKLEQYDREIEGLQQGLRTDLLNFPLREKENFLLARERAQLAAARELSLTQQVEDLSKQLQIKRQSAAAFKPFSGYGQDSVLAAESSFIRLEESSHQVETMEQRLKELAQRRKTTSEQLASLSSCAEVGPNGEEEANSLADQINKLTFDLQARGNQFQTRDTELKRKIRLNTLFSVSALVLGVGIGALLGVLLSPIYSTLGLAGIITAVLLWLHNRQLSQNLSNLKRKISASKLEVSEIKEELQQKKERLTQLLSAAEAESLNELRDKMRQLALVEQSRKTLLLELVEFEDNLAKQRTRVKDEARQLEGLLGPTQVLEPGDIITRSHLEQFSKGINNWLRFEVEEQELLRQVWEQEGQRDKAHREVSSAEAEIQRILELAQVASPQEFLAGCEGSAKLEQKQKSLEALKVLRSEVLGQADLTALQRERDRINNDLLCWQRPGSPRSSESLNADLEAVGLKVQETKESLAKLQGIIDTKLQGVKNLAEVEAELLQSWKEKEQILQRKKALELARDNILEVSRQVQRDFAPQVNAGVGKVMGSITQGRYFEVRIDQDLNLRVIVPETGEAQDIRALSLGTVDQFYFALRLALTEVIGAKFPLIMDEPFAQYDDQRLEASLGILAELASRRQVVLFSCHRRELEMLSRVNGQEYKIIELNT